VARGIVSDDARVMVGRYRRPASHHLVDFGESSVNIVVSDRFWREDWVYAVEFGQNG